MLTCRDVTELATDYQEGALSLRRRLEVHLHLLMCRFCRRYLAQMRTVAEALARLPPEDPPEAVRERLAAAYREAPRPDGRP
jgi:anti-sigma factor ChrR (cupin superfamily)